MVPVLWAGSSAGSEGVSAKAPFRLPLRQGPHYLSDILDADGATVAMGHPCFTQAGSERAEAIRRAVNAHDDLVEALASEAGFLRRFLEKLTHHSVTGDQGQIVNGYAAAEIPEWEMRQRLDDIEAALAKARA